MPLYRYHFSSSPGELSPPTRDLESVEAKSPADVIAILRREGRLPADWRSLWIHVLVWVDQEGKQRGFESIPLHTLASED